MLSLYNSFAEFCSRFEQRGDEGRDYSHYGFSLGKWEDEEALVKEVLSAVQAKGDQALFEYTKRFDRVELTKFKVTEDEVESAYQEVEPSYRKLLQEAKENITRFHCHQVENSWFTESKGIFLGQMVRPLRRVGVYVPGGTAAYPSSVLMTVIPATVAGVEEICLCTPPDDRGKVNPYVLVAASESGVKEIFKVGGAQAIAAMVYGTKTISAVEKIVGPGNIYVMLAKRAVFGLVGTDMPAGPSEVLVVSDETGSPAFIAADLLAQAEHDPLAASYLVTTSAQLFLSVKEELEKQVERLKRREIISRAFAEQGAAIIVGDLAEAWRLVNLIAPEHLELHLGDPLQYLAEIKNAGAIFLGSYTPEPLGDYWAGPSHVLPTAGAARFSSPLGVYDFIKRSSVISYTKEALLQVAGGIETLARVEGLDAHAWAITIRKGGNNEV